MIDFRYHLVSIVAVFLALAIGLVVGATALQGPVVTGLNNTASQERTKINRLEAQNASLSNQLALGQSFARADSTILVSDLLKGQRVVMVLAPGTDSGTVSGIAAEISQAGGTVTAQIQLTPQFFDTSSATENALTSLAQQLAPPGSGLPSPASGDQISGQELVAQVLAYALMRKAGSPSQSASVIQSVLNGLGQQSFLQVNTGNGGTGLTAQADLAVVVIPATPVAKVSDPFNLALVAVADQLRKAGQGAMIAGTQAGSGPGSVIDTVTSGAAGVNLNTVDNADTVLGQIMVVQVLRLSLDPHNTPAAYGIGSGAVPSPAPSTPPSPSASPSASSSASPSPKRSVTS